MDMKRLRKWVEAINTYYAFALLLYAISLLISGHTKLFYIVFFIATPVLSAWSGYLLHAYIVRRNQRHGFRVISDVMSYEIISKYRSVLSYKTTIKAGTDNLMIFPIEHQWTGSGEEAMPRIGGKGQKLIGLLEPSGKSEAATLSPYVISGSTEGDWHAWFVALNPTLHRDETATIDYSQDFQDMQGSAKPILYYYVRIPMKKLELNVKFPKSGLPSEVKCSYIKTSDPRRPRQCKGVTYDSSKQWATWVIEKPKKGYCYRIEWS